MTNTPNRGYPLPSPGNRLSDDVLKLQQALLAIDSDISGMSGNDTGDRLDALIANPEFDGNGSIPDLPLSTNDQSIPNAKFVQDVSQTRTRNPGLLAISLSGNVDNLDPAGLNNVEILEINPTVSLGIGGIAAPSPTGNRMLTIRHSGVDTLLWLCPSCSRTTPQNRFLLPQGDPYFLMEGEEVTIIYSPRKGGWLLFNSKGIRLNADILYQPFNRPLFSDPFLTDQVAYWTVGGWSSHDQRFIPGGYGVSTMNEAFYDASGEGLGGGGATLQQGYNVFMFGRYRVPYIESNTVLPWVFLGFGTGGLLDSFGWSIFGNQTQWEVLALTEDRSVNIRSIFGPNLTDRWLSLGVYLNKNWDRVDYIWSDGDESYFRCISVPVGQTIPITHLNIIWLFFNNVQTPDPQVHISFNYGALKFGDPHSSLFTASGIDLGKIGDKKAEHVWLNAQHPTR